MIAWNSQMALDARQHLFLSEASPRRLWRVSNHDEKAFVLKLYRVEEDMDAVREGFYVESKHLTQEDPDQEDPNFDPEGPEAGTEWAFVEGSVDQFLGQYERVEELNTPSPS